MDREGIAETSPRIGAKRRDIADRDTPFIRDDWYVAARSAEVSRAPMQRVILGEDILLYRKLDGAPVALQNRCAHRSYPLSNGRLNGDRIVCGYHGIEYGPDGRCGLVPSMGAAPSAVRVRSYPVVEDGPFIWIWTGDPAKADETRLLRQPWLTEPDWAHVEGRFHMKANYLGLHENLLDLTHFPFLHDPVIGKPEHVTMPAKFRVLGDKIFNTNFHRDVLIPPAFAAAYPLQAPVNRLAKAITHSPAILYGKAVYIDASTPPKRATRYIIHCMTPETQGSTHYYWALARNVALNDRAVDDEMWAIGHRAFEQDQLALEAIEELVARDHRPDFREKIIPPDKGAILLLRIFARRATQERGEIAPEREML